MVKSIFLSREPVSAAGELVGRRLELEAIRNHLERPRPENVNLIGEPRSGKSSLLYTVYREQVGLPPGMAGLYVWVRLATLRARDPAAFWRLMLRQLAAAAAEMGWSPGAEMPPRQAAKADFYDALDLGLDALLQETACARVIFVLDDFDLLRESLSGEDLDWLRALVNRYSDGLGLVLGSTDPLTQLEAAIQGERNVSSLAPLFQTIRLGLLEEEAAAHLCRRAAELEEFDLTREDLAFLLREAGRHPDLLKVACGWLFAARRLETAAPDKLYADVRSDVRFDPHVHWLCETLYRRQPPPARRILRALAMGETVHEPEVLQTLLRRVGLLEVRDGRYALFADAFRYWVLQQREEEDEVRAAPPAPVAPPALEHLPEQRAARVEGKLVVLTALENRLLEYLLAHAGEICTPAQLLEHVWGPGKSPAVVEKGVNRLRAKIEADPRRPRFILSARGEGYLLRAG
jgi:hypothetical protein